MTDTQLIVITGQTATGKTTQAVQMAKEENGEIINADSRHVYKYLNIVSGKDLNELKREHIPYHLFDIVDPKEQYSSYQYVLAARAAIHDIRARGKTPILVGGTYLYIKHLLYDFDIQVPPNEKLRNELEQKPVKELQEILGNRPADINNSDWNNPRRLIRRIEIRQSFQPSRFNLQGSNEGLVVGSNLTVIGLHHDTREKLVSAIKERVEKRLEQGALEEVENLLTSGYTAKDPGLQTIGYQQIIAFLQGEYTKQAAIEEWITKEIQYAKRQLTFMKKDPYISWRTV